MKSLIVFLVSVFMSNAALANCISLEEAKSVAYGAINELERENPSEDYAAWEDAVFNLEFASGQGEGYYTSSFSVSNWQDIRLFVSCEGAFKYEAVFTED